MNIFSKKARYDVEVHDTQNHFRWDRVCRTDTLKWLVNHWSHSNYFCYESTFAQIGRHNWIEVRGAKCWHGPQNGEMRVITEAGMSGKWIVISLREEVFVTKDVSDLILASYTYMLLPKVHDLSCCR